jgi:hypothetical protein
VCRRGIEIERACRREGWMQKGGKALRRRAPERIGRKASGATDSGVALQWSANKWLHGRCIRVDAEHGAPKGNTSVWCGDGFSDVACVVGVQHMKLWLVTVTIIGGWECFK